MQEGKKRNRLKVMKNIEIFMHMTYGVSTFFSCSINYKKKPSKTKKLMDSINNRKFLK